MYLLAAVILGTMLGGPVGAMIVVFLFVAFRVAYVISNRKS